MLKDIPENKKSFEELYSEYKNFVLQTACYYTNYDEVAKDIMQSTFMKLYIHYDHLEQTYIKRWLAVTARNLALNEEKRREVEILDDDIVMTSDLYTSTEKLEDEYWEEERRKEILYLEKNMFAALYKYNERWYQAVTLAYCLHWPQQDVADEMDMSLESLHSMLQRARKWLKKYYKKYSKEK